jgi:CheY-like chemotaxis protein
MQGVFIFSDFKPFTKEIIEQLGIPDKHVISTQTFNKENNYHDWLVEMFKNNEIKKILIPLNLNTNDPINDGLKIALHIRLNYELPVIKRLVPIIFISDLTLDVIISKTTFDSSTNPQNLLFTKSVFLTSFDIDEIKHVIQKVEPCAENEYHVGILNKLKITQRASVGKHSISNAWGCFKLAQVAGLRDEIYKNENVAEHLKTLYAKYLICYNESYTNDKLIDLSPIKCIGKKILFIDDQSEDGWSILMKNIFKSAGNNFLAIDSSKYMNHETKLFHDFDGFYSECLKQIGIDWDLIIMDLRLNPEKEDIDSGMIQPTELSGYKLINEFLNQNEGYQIIVSTASNKIWNINSALRRGASSYYIKESPEFNYSLKDTKKNYDNFKEDVNKCFEKNYLRRVDIVHKKCLKYITVDSPGRGINYQIFYDRTIASFQIAFELLGKTTINPKYFNLAFLTYFQIIEDFVGQRENFQRISNRECYVGSSRTRIIDDSAGILIWKLTYIQDRVNGDYFIMVDEVKPNEVSIQTLAKVSFVLAFMFHKDNSFLKKWANLNNIRNTKAGHGGANGYVTSANIEELLEIIELIFT